MLRSPVALWSAFALVHLWLALLGWRLGVLSDVGVVYRSWMDQGMATGHWPGIHDDWVYPVVAALPMLVARWGGDHGLAVWLLLVSVLDGAALVVLTWPDRRDVRGRPVTLTRRQKAAWWWLTFLVVLGPIALGRIDAVSVPLALVGLLLVSARPALASALLTVGAWIKVWPAALVASAVIVSRRRLPVLVGALTTSLVVVVVSLLLGSGRHVFGFFGQQSGRGLQVEAPAALVWLWRASIDTWLRPGVSDDSGPHVVYDAAILTYEVRGPGVTAMTTALSVAMEVAAVVVVLIGVRAVRSQASPVAVVAPLSLAFVTVMIVTNKVGSPQFVSWVAVPVVVGLVAAGVGGPSFAVPAGLSLATASLTQIVYPLAYDEFLAVQPAVLAIVTLRAGLEIALLVWAVRCLWRSGDGVRAARSAGTTTDRRPLSGRGRR